MGKDKHTGFIDDCSEAQKQVLQEFKNYIKEDLKITDPTYDDWYLLRFCRARKFEKEKVYLMFRNFINWRKEVNIDEIPKLNYPNLNKIQELYRHGYVNTDKKGRPVYIEQNGIVNPEDVFKLFNNDMDLMMKYYILSYERLIHVILPACSKAAGKRIEQTCTILDVKGISISKLLSDDFKKFLKMTVSIAQDYYPELMGNMYIVNAPLSFRILWAFVSPFIDPKTKTKIKILGSDYIKALKEEIDINNIPTFLGGNFTGNIIDNNGPWHQAFNYAIENKLMRCTDKDIKVPETNNNKEKDAIKAPVTKSKIIVTSYLVENINLDLRNITNGPVININLY